MRFGPAILCVALVATPAWAADQLAFGPVAAWVVPQQLAAAQGTDEASVTVLLYDSQAKLDPGRSATYLHYAMRINNAQGLSAAHVAAAWDPAFETATVHRLAIRRGATVIDVLASGQKFTVLRREQNLEQQTLDGRLTATIQPEGVQVGDIVEVQVTIVRADPTLKDHMEAAGQLSMPMPVTRAQIRVVTPAGTPLRQRLTGLGPPAVEQKGGTRTLTWTVTGLQPQTSPAFAPDRFAIDRRVELTAFRSWDDLAALFVPLFARASTIAAGSPLHQEVARIKAASSDPAIRAGLALQLVQDKVRYVNLALGVGGLVPTEADRTWQRRFGDCKAKTALLVALLRELGIEGVPVLVHSSLGDGLDARLPMVAQFDHVLVRTTIAGRDYWLDGTRSGDSSLALIKVPFFRWGLPLVRNAQLVRIQPAPLTRPTTETIIHTDASKGGTQPAPTRVELIVRGEEAVGYNMLLSQLAGAVREDAQRQMLQKMLDRFEIDKVASSFDAGRQEFRLRGEGRQTLDLDRGTYWSEVPSLGYKADFTRTSTRDRNAPVALGFPTYSRTVQTLILPADRIDRATVKGRDIKEVVAGVEYERRLSKSGTALTVEASVRSLVPEIAYADAVAAVARLRELDGEDVGFRLEDATAVEASTVKELIGRDATSAGDYHDAAIKLLQANRMSEGLGAIDKAVSLAPTNAEHRALRAEVRLTFGNQAGAEEDALAAIKAKPAAVGPRMLLASLYTRQGKRAAALDLARGLEGIDVARTQAMRGQLLLQLDRPDDALAAFDQALALEPDPMIHVYRANAIPASDRAARLKELDAGLKLSPTDGPVLDGLARLASQLGDRTRAMTLFDQALLKAPDDIAVRSRRAVEMALAGKTAAANREFDALLAKNPTAFDLNNMCWDKALANVALDRALDECNRSLAKDPNAATRDSKGVVLLRLSRFDEAIAEFDLALKNNELAAARFGRGLAYARKGDRARADADFAKAAALAPGIERVYAYAGLTR